MHAPSGGAERAWEWKAVPLSCPLAQEPLTVGRGGRERGGERCHKRGTGVRKTSSAEHGRSTQATEADGARWTAGDARTQMVTVAGNVGQSGGRSWQGRCRIVGRKNETCRVGDDPGGGEDETKTPLFHDFALKLVPCRDFDSGVTMIYVCPLQRTQKVGIAGCSK